MFNRWMIIRHPKIIIVIDQEALLLNITPEDKIPRWSASKTNLWKKFWMIIIIHSPSFSWSFAPIKNTILQDCVVYRMSSRIFSQYPSNNNDFNSCNIIIIMLLHSCYMLSNFIHKYRELRDILRIKWIKWTKCVIAKHLYI